MIAGSRGQYTRSDAVVDLEEEMNSLGHPIPLTSLFRGCSCVFLDGEDGSQGSSAGDSLQGLQAEYQRLVVGSRFHLVSLRMKAHTTPDSPHKRKVRVF